MMEEQKVFEMKIITNHNKLYFKLKENAPRRTVSENTGRGRDHMGIGGYGEVSSGYRAIMVYIQLGLSDHGELIREIVNLILEVQKGYGTKYPIIPAAFGKGNEFISDKKYFEMGYYADRQSARKIAEVIGNLSGLEKSDTPAIVPSLFPKTDMRSLYSGKTKFDSDDLMVIIGKKNEIAFSKQLEGMPYRLKKRILIVAIDNDSVNWSYKNIEPIFINMEEEMAKLTKCSGFQTKSFARNNSIISRIANVAAHIHEYIISEDDMINWETRINQGSFTFQNKTDPQKVITIFCDIDNKLAEKNKLTLHDDPLAIGIELTNEIKLTRNLIRDELLKKYHGYYLDPRSGHSQYYLMPQKEHIYDIVFLLHGHCEAPRYLIDKYSMLIEKSIKLTETSRREND